MTETFQCRSGCGACCVIPGIAEPFFGMPGGKPAGTPCIHLNDSLGCKLFNDPRRPACCSAFRPDPDVCGTSREQAISLLKVLDTASQPEID